MKDSVLKYMSINVFREYFKSDHKNYIILDETSRNVMVFPLEMFSLVAAMNSILNQEIFPSLISLKSLAICTRVLFL